MRTLAKQKPKMFGVVCISTLDAACSVYRDKHALGRMCLVQIDPCADPLLLHMSGMKSCECHENENALPAPTSAVTRVNTPNSEGAYFDGSVTIMEKYGQYRDKGEHNIPSVSQL